MESPDAIARLCREGWPQIRELAARLRKPPPFIVINARGSSGHAGIFAKYLIESECGVFVGHYAQAITTAYHARISMPEVLFLSISQSGQSPDLIESAAAARDAGALTVAIVNDAQSPLAKASEIVLPMMAGAETSPGATKSFIASLSIVLGLVAAWRGEAGLETAFRQLPGMLAGASTRTLSDFDDTFTLATHSFVIGRGFGFALACEAALKFKELCGHHAEAFSAAEVRHGPIALAGQSLGILAFDQLDATSASIRAARDAATAAGALAITIVPPGIEPMTRDRPFDAAARTIPLILTFYLHVERVARKLGRDPDRPNIIAKVTGTR